MLDATKTEPAWVMSDQTLDVSDCMGAVMDEDGRYAETYTAHFSIELVDRFVGNDPDPHGECAEAELLGVVVSDFAGVPGEQNYIQRRRVEDLMGDKWVRNQEEFVAERHDAGEGW